jgi:hypothetical protein
VSREPGVSGLPSVVDSGRMVLSGWPFRLVRSVVCGLFLGIGGCGGSSELKTVTSHFGAYAIVFRHGSALIALAYVATSPKKHVRADISAANFIKLANTLNSRL